MTKQTQEALKMAYDWLNEYAPPEVVQACKEALEQPTLTYEDGFAHGYEAHRAEQALEQLAQEVKCNPHPDAPHGFMRDESHSQDRYVCECEYWTPPAQEPIEYLGAMANVDGSVNLYYKKSSWQGLDNNEQDIIFKNQLGHDCSCDPYSFYLAIEQALKEKNNAV